MWMSILSKSGLELVVRTARKRMQILQRFLIVRLVGMRKMGEVLGGRLFPKPEQAELRRTYIDSMRGLVGWSVADRVNAIDCLTLVIAADEDYTPVTVKEAYVSNLKQAELVVIEDSRHATPAERPEAFNQAVMAFLAQRV